MRKEAKRAHCCAIVLIDAAPLRSAAARECTGTMACLEEARAAWHRFEREDKPACVRWRAREFGVVLSDLRNVETEIRDAEALVHEVEMEMRRGFFDPQVALQRVRLRRGGAPIETPEPQWTSGSERRVSEFEQEALFQEWVHRFIGTNPDKLDDDAYATTFEAFKAHMFSPRRAEPPPAANIREAPPEPEEDEPEPAAADPRLKELYRVLVRRLHPDLRADGNAAASMLWHEVQEAYAATDIAHMEILLALSDIQDGPFSDQTSVSQMRALAAELKRALFALDDSLRQARDDDAWDFARAGVRDHLHARVERELHATLRTRSQRLALLRQTIAGWSASAFVSRAAARG